MPDPNPFEIDGGIPTGFEGGDTRHAVIPGRLTATRRERFPGQRTGVVIKGRALHPSIIVEGPMRADTFAALYTLITTYQGMQEDIPLKTVSLHGEDFDNCDLAEFRVLGRHPVPYTDDTHTAAAPGMKIRVRFTFHQLFV